MIPMTLNAVAEAVGAPPEGTECVTVRRVTIDSRDVTPGDLFVAIRGDRFDGHRFIDEACRKGAVACVADKAWVRASGEPAAPCLVVEDTIRALGRLAGHYRHSVMSTATVVVAVTGTNGKTTTKSMIDHVLAGSFVGRSAPKNFNNHIGVPLTLLSSEAGDRYLVVEVGTNAPGEVNMLAAMADPHAGVITSIGEAHLQGLGGIEGVAAEKASLLAHVRSDGLAVVNIDRREIRPHLSRVSAAKLLTIGADPSARLSVAGARGDIRKTVFELDGRFTIELPMPGLHHATNAAAAFAVGRWFGVAPEVITERLRTFVPMEGRTCVRTCGGVTIVDDAYNANPASVLAAIDTLRRIDGRRVFVLGDMLELGCEGAAFHVEAVRTVVDAGIDVLVAVGLATTQAVAALSPAQRTRIITCGDAAEAGDELMALAAPGDVVWVKGSRAVGLERVVERLDAGSDSQAAVA